MISKEALEEYKAIYKEKTGKDLSDQEASEQSNNLVNFFALLLKIDRRNAENNLRNKK